MSTSEEQPMDEGLPAPRRSESERYLTDYPRRREIAEPLPNVLTLSTGGDEDKSAFSFASVWSAVLHRFWVAAPLGVILATVSVGALWYLGEDQYRSSAWLRIRDKPEYIAFPSSENSRRFVDTQVELLRSPVVVGQAVETPAVRELGELKAIEGREDATSWVSQRLKVRPIGRSDLYEIAMVTGEPESASIIATAIVDSYMNFHAATSDFEYARKREVLAEVLRQKQRDCDLKREQFRELNRQAAGTAAGVIEDSDGQTVSGRLDILGEIQKQLLGAELKSINLEADIAGYRETLAREIRISDQDLVDLVEGDRQLLAWKEELSAARESLKFATGPSSPLRKTLETRTTDLEQRIAKRREDLRPQLEKAARDRIDEGRKSELDRMRDELTREQGFITFYRNRIAEERAQLQVQGDVSMELELARRDLEHAQRLHDVIHERIARMEVEARAPSQIDVVQAAKIPVFPEGTTLPKKMTALGLVAFLLPFGLFAGYELLVKRIYDSNQLRRETEIDFVGEVSTLPIRRRLRSDRAFERQAYILEESVDSIRTALAVSDRQQAQKVIVVCSAISGEGKTHLSSQLALSWCRGESGPVLIIDADMRSPGLQQMFDIDLQPGLVEVLRGTATLQEAIVTDWGEGIHILPAGKLELYHPDRLIASQRFIRLLEVAREHYSRIIIDVPPILSAHETLMIAKLADGALLCALRDYSRTNQFQEAHQRLTRAGVNVMGAVLNGVPTQSYVYHYGSYS